MSNGSGSEVPTSKADWEQVESDLIALLSDEQVSATGADRNEHSLDQSSHEACQPDLVVWPRSTENVQDVLRYANAVAALKCRALGARTAIPSREEVERLLASPDYS